MIEVVFAGGEGVAFADCPESALLAARTLWDDSRLSMPNLEVGSGGMRRHAPREVTFIVDGVAVRTVTDRRELG